LINDCVSYFFSVLCDGVKIRCSDNRYQRIFSFFYGRLDDLIVILFFKNVLERAGSGSVMMANILNLSANGVCQN